MPMYGKRKYPAKRAGNSDGSDNDGAAARYKKTKTDGESSVRAGDEESWPLSGKRKVSLSEFKGTTYVNIREYYEKDGQELPGKKGITLNLEQYRALISIIPKINNALLEKGLTLPILDRVPEADEKKAEKKVDNKDEEEEEEE